jgi:hypothetical protein
MLCVLALLGIAVGHSCQHVEPGTAQAVLSLGDLPTGDTTPTDAVAVADHCPVCSAAWLPARAAAAPIVPMSEPVAGSTTLLRPFVPSAETPPPIA